MEPKSEHVNFRGGELMDRLRQSPLTTGATAKRDLVRYYALVDECFDQWWRGNGVDDDAWALIVGFVSTRDWPGAPDYLDFARQFGLFMRSPMTKDFDREVKTRAFTALSLARYPEIVSILDRAERRAAKIGYFALATDRDAATADAT